ncbi:MAG TPA: DUF3857 and transglutaminase domain-containing protein [candidate division Zixibacteria bacterium]|nr:DUF3857 and transglutaminase domain-containing protein [candidate division Zixibacteria bacterium]
MNHAVGRIRSLFFLLLTSFASIVVFAADFPPVNPEELKIASCPKQPGAPAYVLYREETDDDELHYHQVYERIKILTEEGRRQADVQIPYYYKGYTIADIHGRTTHPDGSTVTMETKPFEKVIVVGQDLRYKVKAFTLPDVEVGSVIEYRYVLRYADDRVVPARWYISDDLYQEELHFSFKPAPMSEHRYVVLSHGEAAKTVAWTWYTPHNEEPKRIISGKYEMTLKDVPAFLKEEYMPPSDVLKYHVFFYYSSGFYGIADFWREQGKYWNKDLEKFTAKHSLVDDQVAKLVGSSETPEQKVRKLYAFAQSLENTTYKQQRSAEEMKALGLKQSRGADDVLAQKSGNDDEITRLFIAMVRRAGIPAYAARVTARDDSYFMDSLLEFDQLNHELAIVQLNGKEVFLAPGIPYVPFGQLHWKVTDCRGIRQTPNGKTDFVSTPGSNYTENLRRRNVKLAAPQIGPATGTVTVEYRGQQAIIHRLNARDTDAAGRTKMLEDEVRGWLPADAEVKLVNSPEWENAEKPLQAVFEVSCNIFAAAGHRTLVPVHILQMNSAPLFSHAERLNKIYFSYPYAELDETRITLPEGLQLERIPEAVKNKLDFAAYITDYAKNGREFIAGRQLVMGLELFDVKQYKTLKSFYDDAHTQDQSQAVIQGSNHASGN